MWWWNCNLIVWKNEYHISVSRIERLKHFKAIAVNDFMALHYILVFLLMWGPTNVTGIEMLFVPHMDSVDVHGSLSHFIHRVTSRWFYFHKLIFPQSRFSGFEKRHVLILLDTWYGGAIRNLNGDDAPYENKRRHCFLPHYEVVVHLNWDINLKMFEM